MRCPKLPWAAALEQHAQPVPAIVRPRLQTGFMENHSVQEFHVTYFDADCGRSRSEVFDTMAEAQRFANRYCHGEDSWAVIDAVTVEPARVAA
ncbi:hypothetical protein ARTHROSP310_19050 [Arthrobacter sp. AD-310]